jgi:hypothetical protein
MSKKTNIRVFIYVFFFIAVILIFDFLNHFSYGFLLNRFPTQISHSLIV